MKKHYVMVIDDDVFSIELYNMIIGWTEHAHHFQAEINPVKAMDELNHIQANSPERFPDFILLDLKMPELDGFDFIKQFEKNFPQRKNKSSFIITTSSVRKKDKEKAMTFDSVKKFLIKPIPGDFIEKLILEGLNGQQ